MAREVTEGEAATFLMPKDIAAELLAEQDLADLVIPADLSQAWRDWFRSELARLCDDPA
jgi:hypothetical protein